MHSVYTSTALFKPLPNFMLIWDPLTYDKILNILDFQNFRTTFTISKLSIKYTKEISQNSKEIGRYHIFKNKHLKVIIFINLEPGVGLYRS